MDFYLIRSKTKLLYDILVGVKIVAYIINYYMFYSKNYSEKTKLNRNTKKLIFVNNHKV